MDKKFECPVCGVPLKTPEEVAGCDHPMFIDDRNFDFGEWIEFSDRDKPHLKKVRWQPTGGW